jgi:membrane protease YdiL (CAAX protease family)
MKISSCFNKSVLSALLLFPIVNCGLFFFSSNVDNWFNIKDFSDIFKQAGLLVFVALAEELFFRGVLFRELAFSYKTNLVLVAVIVSLLFGVLHLLNIFSYATLHYAIVQSLCAFAISFDLSAIYRKFNSIVPCIVIHALINITSIGQDGGLEKLSLNGFEATMFLIVAIFYLVHGYKLFTDEQFCIDKGED